MKKLLTFFALLLLAQSCTKETDVSLGGDTSSVAVSFTASVVSTKATLINSWSGGEEVALFVDGDSKAYHFTVAADGTMSGDEVVIDREENITYTAFYPYDDSLTTAVEYEAACEAGNVDYMSATTETSGKDVALPFTHLMSALSFKIVIEGETTTPAISLAVDGDFGSAVALDVETTRGTLFSQLVANYFVEAGTDISSAMIKVEHSNSTTFHSIARDDSNTLMAGSQYPFSGSIGDVPIGTGVEDAPFMVYFADDMRKVGTEPDGWSLSSHYKLAQDIDLGGEEFTTIGSYDHSIDLRFKGTFDGDGYEISGLYINQPDADCQGLFGYIIDATIKNLGVSGSVTGRICVGGIVGCSHNSSIENCYNKATIVGYGYNIGGIAGSGTTINNCFNTGSVTGSGDDEDSYSVGGIAGECSGELSNCYNTGAVKSSSGHAVGGVAGINIEVVSNSYNIGSVTGNIDVGGVVGYQSIPDDLGTTTYSYYDSEVVTGVEGAVDGENSGTDYCGLSKTNMQGAASTDGTLLYYLTNESYGDSSEWVADTENINGGYPILTWQTSNN